MLRRKNRRPSTRHAAASSGRLSRMHSTPIGSPTTRCSTVASPVTPPGAISFGAENSDTDAPRHALPSSKHPSSAARRRALSVADVFFAGT